MLITNQTAQDYWFGPLHLLGGNGQTLTVDDTTATSLYLTDDGVADAINTLATSNKIQVTGAASPFPRPTGTPQILHADGSPEGLVYAGQGSLYLRRDVAAIHIKTTGIHVNTGWLLQIASSPGAPALSLPGSPADGQQAILTDSLTAPTYAWTFQFNAEITDSYKWIFIGGAPGSSEVDAQESPNSTSYTNCSTVHSFPTTYAGIYELDYGYECHLDSGFNNDFYVSPKYSASEASDNDAARTNLWTPSSGQSGPADPCSKNRRITITSNGQTITMRYRQSTADATTTYVKKRWLKVTPVRVSG